MIARLNQGGQVTAPLRNVTYEGMTGYVMLVNNPDGRIGDSYLFNMFQGGGGGHQTLFSQLLRLFPPPRSMTPFRLSRPGA
jgi:hypothetical protein